MEEVLKQLKERTGLDHDKAKIAVAIVLGELKGKLPDEVASQLDGVMTGQQFDFKEMLGDKFGDLKEELEGKLKNKLKGLKDLF